MADYLSLEEAAAKLGVPAERLVELRSQGQVRGFRDGASWKFPETEIERLKDELDDLGAGSGLLVSEPELGSAISSSSSSIIGGDDVLDDGTGSDLEIGGEPVKPGSSGSDVNLVASDRNGSDVALVASGSDIDMDEGVAIDSDDLDSDDDFVEIDSGELELGESLSQESSELDLAIEPKEGSTGPISKRDLPADDMKASESGSAVDLGGEADSDIKSDGDLSFAGTIPDEDSDEAVIGDEDSSAMDLLNSDVDLAGVASSLELMDDLDGAPGDELSMEAPGADVLSELDLLSAEQQGSDGLVTGDSEELLVSSGANNLDKSSGLGSSLGEDVLADIDAIDDDDDLVIADDDDDLLIDSAGSDISVAGDSGINLMSPSDSGLSLESEPLDLAGSSISALDLGAELAEGGSGSSGVAGGDGSAIEFQSDEEFQLSPSGVGFDAEESGSQVIEVEDSEAIGEAVEFEGAEFAAADPLGGDVFAEEPAVAEDVGFVDEGEAVAIDETSAAPVPSSTALGGYEVPFSLLQCGALLAIICVMSIGGMLMTDLLRNMWTYTAPSAPVSSLTDALIDVAGWGR